MPYAEHADVDGFITLSQSQYDDVYQALGWVLLTSPPGMPPQPFLIVTGWSGTWQASTVYAKGSVVRTPGGGLIIARQDLTTDTTFNMTGFDRLVDDPGGGGSPAAGTYASTYKATY